MKLRRTSQVTGIVHVMELNCTTEEFDEMFEEYRKGALAQDAFSTLNANEREFIMTGITPQEWKMIFGADDIEDALG